MTNLTDELANWVLRINALCAEKDAEIERLRADNERLKKIEQAAHRYWRAWHHENSETIELQAELLRLAVNEHAAPHEQHLNGGKE